MGINSQKNIENDVKEQKHFENEEKYKNIPKMKKETKKYCNHYNLMIF